MNESVTDGRGTAVAAARETGGAHASALSVIDIATREPRLAPIVWVLRLFGIAVLLTLSSGVSIFLVAVLSQFLFPAAPPIVAVIGGVAVVLLLVGATLRRWSRRKCVSLATFLATRRHDSTQDWLSALARELPRYCRPAGWSELAAVLARLGRFGTVIRFGRVQDLSDVEGVRVAFEPRLLSERDESFEDLLATIYASPRADDELRCTSTGDARSRFSGEPRASARAKVPPSTRPPMANRASASAGRVRGIADWMRGSEWRFVVSVLGLTMLTVNAARNGQTVLMGLLGVATLWAFGGGLARLIGAASGDAEPEVPEWFVLPGAVAIKYGGRHPIAWLRPAAAVLILGQESHNRWQAILSDAAGTHKRGLTRREVEALTACWTSPLDPPPREHVVRALGSPDGRS